MSYDFKKIEKKWAKKWEDKQTFKAQSETTKPKFYVLDMFPYPSGAGLHVGHPLGYIGSDIYARYMRLRGYNVLHPMGFDSFGLPAEQYAILTGQHPSKTTTENIKKYKEQLKSLGLSFDWSKELKTSNPDYYKWTQWIFSKLFNAYYCYIDNKALPISDLIQEFEINGNTNIKSPCNDETPIFTAKKWNNWNEEEQQTILLNYRLAYLSDSIVNWCPELGTVLANDEVSDGLSIRGGHPVYQKKMKQWCLRISAYSDRLLSDLEGLDWPTSLKEQQKNWIGKSYGLIINFKCSEKNINIPVFTTRPDTIFGVTFLVLSPEHSAIENIITSAHKEQVEKYIKLSRKKSEREKISNIHNVSGVFSGTYAINPINNQKIPIWISDYVLSGYGSGAIMAVPGHDTRDFKFAKKFKLDIKTVIANNTELNEKPTEPYLEKKGLLINSEYLNNLNIQDALKKITTIIKEKKYGDSTINYKMRDATFSRQRYWGEPFPIYYKNNVPYIVDEKDLPITLPDVESYLPTKEGRPPLARSNKWKYKSIYDFEHSTMPGWAGSSWYFLRYIDPNNNNEFVNKKLLNYWQNVDLYIGGSEHATGHLMYSRFWTKFLYDLKYIPFDEPFKKLINQGMILGQSYFVYRIQNKNTFVSYNLKGNYQTTKIHVDINIVKKGFLDINKFKESQKNYEKAEFILEDEKYICGSATEKMSKSFYNVVTPDSIIEEYGADALRMHEMFLGPLTQHKPWNTDGISGVFSFLKKFWSLFHSENDEFFIDNEEESKEELIMLHKTIKKIQHDIENFSFNTSISSFMILVNYLKKENCYKQKILEPLVILLSPFAPFICEEIWQKLKSNSTSIAYSDFPKYDSSFLLDENINYPIAINGKKKASITVASNLNNDEVQEIALNDEKIRKILNDKKIRKIIVIPKKIINIVIK